MDVRLPNGKIIKNVPEGTSKEAVMAKAISTNMFDPKSNMVNQPQTIPRQPEGNTFGQFANAAVQGVGQGMTLGFMDEMVGAVTPGVPLEQAQFDHPMFTTAMEMVGSMGPAMWASKLIKGMRTAVGLGAVEGGIYGAGTSEDFPTLLDISIPTVAGIAGSLGSHNLSILAKKLLKPNDALGRVTKADEMGYPITYADRTGSDAAKLMESSFESNPFVLNPHSSLKPRQDIINREVMKALGVNDHSGVISEKDLLNAKKAIGAKFEAVKGPNSPAAFNINKKPFEEISNNAIKDSVNNKSIKPYIKKFFKEVDGGESPGTITGREYLARRTKLSTYAKQQMTSPMGSREVGMDLFKVMDNIDEQISKQLPESIAENLNRGRAEWKTLVALKKGKALDTATGNVNYNSLATSLENIDKNAFKMTTDNPLYETLKMAKSFPPLANSQTATRGAITQNLLTGSAGGFLGGPAGFLGMLLAPSAGSATLRGLNTLTKGDTVLTKFIGDTIQKRAPIDNLINVLLNQEQEQR